jgi:hypothetical protein
MSKIKGKWSERDDERGLRMCLGKMCRTRHCKKNIVKLAYGGVQSLIAPSEVSILQMECNARQMMKCLYQLSSIRR